MKLFVNLFETYLFWQPMHFNKGNSFQVGPTSLTFSSVYFVELFLKGSNFTAPTNNRFGDVFASTGRQIPYGLAVRIRRFHRRGPGSTPGVGT